MLLVLYLLTGNQISTGAASNQIPRNIRGMQSPLVPSYLLQAHQVILALTYQPPILR